MAVTATRAQVLGYRVRVQQLDRAAGGLDDTAVLDLGVQDTGPDGGLWALAIRGVDVSALSGDALATVWTLRGAPHLYRRADLPAVAVAVSPYSDDDAGKRIFDASRPLKEAGIGNLAALGEVSDMMRSLVTHPMAKGAVSSALTARMGQPYLRFCRPCNTTHLYEMPFRLAALHAGLELQPGTSPPVLQPIPGFRRARRPSRRLDVIRGYLHLLGPATYQQVAEYVDAPLKDIRSHWPEDVTEVSVGDETRWMLTADAARLEEATPGVTRLLGPFDLFLQARDRRLLVPDRARAKALWPTLGRPGAVLHAGELVGEWRPRKSGRRFRVQVTPWGRLAAPVRRALEEQAESLAAYRGVPLSGVDLLT